MVTVELALQEADVAKEKRVEPVNARKVHKADREKLRRNRINEQFVELASVLGSFVNGFFNSLCFLSTIQMFCPDPARPKNDKATIICDSISTVMELRREIAKLKTERAALLEEQKEVNPSENTLKNIMLLLLVIHFLNKTFGVLIVE